MRRQPHVSGQGAILLSALPHSFESRPMHLRPHHGSRGVDSRRCLETAVSDDFSAQSKKCCGG